MYLGIFIFSLATLPSKIVHLAMKIKDKAKKEETFPKRISVFPTNITKVPKMNRKYEDEKIK